ncbi:MAG: [FeFe] hydrogenase H-cluster radical SAM maturase HydG [Lactobacillus sp.]|jgi:2-iminoacetate synthase|nr:[FeFe] hydrogenase H-cluster radical SAM maturase HydG [Lactobacillus sp.]
MLPKIDTEGLKSFIPEEEIHELLQKKTPEKAYIRDIISKSLDKNRLDPHEMAALFNVTDPDLIMEIKEGAKGLKELVYGNRIVLFAPLYVGNECINNCSYCGFRKTNMDIIRKSLTMKELEEEIRGLENRGHKRLIMVYGEHPMYDANFIHDTVKKVYSIKEGNGEIRRVNINAAPLDVEGFRRVKEAGIGTYQIFQETYHQPTYKSVHPSGPKSDYLWRLFAFDRAMEAGIDDIGMGALMGLYDHRFEAMAMLYHTIHLEEKFGCGPHTISFPRIEPAIGTEYANNPPHQVKDEDFMKMIAIIRLAVPYTGMILTCRENTALRDEAISYGISQIDAGSDIGVGAYSNEDKLENSKKSQFVLNDNRSLDEVVCELCESGQLPSFCTGCYRKGRTGEHFMECAVPGFVKNYCTPNGILTLLEYLIDYASPSTKARGLKALERQIADIPDTSSFKPLLLSRIDSVKKGERDLYF